jgi:chitodextrinase
VTGYRVFVDGSQAGTTAAISYTVSGLSCGSSHQIVVDAFDAAGNRSPQTSATMATSACPAPPPGDTTPPSTPTGLAVSSAGQTSLALSWNASSDNVGVAGYGVYKSGTLAASPAGMSYTLTGLSCGTSYTVAVDAFDAAGNRSAKTTITTSTAACPDTQAPTAPSGVTPATRTATSISISWTASTDNVGVAGYDLYLAGSQVGTATSTAYTFTGLTCNTNYTLAVDAYDAAGNHSAQTITAIATTACPDTTPPSTPNGLAASSVGQTSLTLSWTASTDNVGVTGYRMFVNGSQVGTSSSTSYGFSGLACGTSYTLGVAAVDAAGNLSGTATITAATAACSGGSGSNFSGTFTCYGVQSLPSSCYSLVTPCTTTVTTSTALTTAIGTAAGGDVICLNGSSFNAGTVSAVKSSDVTIQPAAGQTPTLQVDFVGAQHWVVLGLTLADSGTMELDASRNIQIIHSTFAPNAGGLNVCTTTGCGSGTEITNEGILLD